MDRERIQKLRKLREQAQSGGGEERIRRQHKKGKLTARERIDYFLDDGTFHEIDSFRRHHCTNFDIDEEQPLGDGVVTGYGEVNGRDVYLFAHDFTVFGGSLGKVFAEKVCKVMDRAMDAGAPIVSLNDSAGARIQEGVESLAGYAEIFHRNQQASGVVPQISAIMGPCAGGAVYSPAITDFIIMVEESSHMMITGPDVIETVTGEQVSFSELGGTDVHTSKSGVADLSEADEKVALDQIRRLLSYLPSNNCEKAPRIDTHDSSDRDTDAAEYVPADPEKPYDVTDVINEIVDTESFFELSPANARNMVTGFARMNGHSVGVVANQPRFNAGTIDIDASLKAARFVRCCDAFNIPIITLVDVPGFMPGSNQEHNGIIRHGAKLLFAYSEATVPLMTVVTRKAYGGAYDVMASKHLDVDINYAWPTAEIAVMGPDGAVRVLYDDELSEAEQPEKEKASLVDEYRETFANPYTAADRGYVDDVIEPQETRRKLITDLEMLQSKRTERPDKKHGNIPL